MGGSERARLVELSEMLDAAVFQSPPPARTVPSEKLVIDQRVYPRATIDLDRVGQMREALREGAVFPPILVASDGVTVIDGAHRTIAYREEGQDARVVAVDVNGMVDVILLSMLANSPHLGMPMRKEDLSRAAGLLAGEFRKEGKTFRDGLKSLGGSLESVAAILGITGYRLNRFIAEYEGPEQPSTGGGGRRPPTAKRRDEPEPSWGGPAGPSVPSEAVRAVLATPASVEPVLVESAWVSLVGSIVKTAAMFRSLKGGLDDAAITAYLVPGLARLPEEDKSLLYDSITDLFVDLIACVRMAISSSHGGDDGGSTVHEEGA